jgi:2-polyprenyl-3-methyl-5-hydroxy-6-metoxy-1,4-benzoquinol methylase
VKKNTGENEERFGFGKNWSNFLTSLDETRIVEAESSLKEKLQVDHLDGLRFVDVGSGSGLFSLAAQRLGAVVRSFDFDVDSVLCTKALKGKYFPHDENWIIEQASALDQPYLNSIGAYDVVYFWGVLHHTGEMWQAISNAIDLVAPKGLIFIAIYNDQGWKSNFWWCVKFFSNSLPSPLKKPFAYILGTIFLVVNILKYTILLKPMIAIRRCLNASGSEV